MIRVVLGLVFSIPMFYRAVFLMNTLHRRLVQSQIQCICVVYRYLIAYTKDKEQERWKGYWYAGLMLAVVMFQSIVLHQYFQNCTIVGMRLRTAIIGSVYEKVSRPLKLKIEMKNTNGFKDDAQNLYCQLQHLFLFITCLQYD